MTHSGLKIGELKKQAARRGEKYFYENCIGVIYELYSSLINLKSNFWNATIKNKWNALSIES